jgi:hypothetical protein
MGGKALSKPSVRFPRAVFATFALHVLCALERAFPDVEFRVTRSLAAKHDFGDLDILYAASETIDVSVAMRALGGVEFFRENNSAVTSIGVPAGPGHEAGSLFQVDLIQVPEDCMSFAICYFAFNDLGGFIGVPASKLGFSLGWTGLSYKAMDPDSPTQQIGRLTVTKNWDEALTLLGYDAILWRLQERGETGFRVPEDAFRYALSGRLVYADWFAPEQRSGRQRRRDVGRPMFQLLQAWLLDPSSEAYWRPLPPDFDLDACRTELLQSVKFAVPKFRAGLADMLAAHAAEKQFRQIFNGHRVARLTGLQGPPLGAFLEALRMRAELPVVAKALADGNADRLDQWILERFRDRCASS